MPSLLQLLHDATGYGALEIVLEAGRSPTMRTGIGVETMPASLTESELFEALGAVLGPDQQAELAVGNVVEFQLHDGVARWHLMAEAGVDGVVVRGRTGAGPEVAEVGVPLELPPLRRSLADGASGSPAAGPTRKTRDTAWDLPSVTTTPPPTPESGQMPSWLVAAGMQESTNSGVRVEPDPIDFAMRRRPPTGEPPASLEHVDEPPLGRSAPSDPFALLAAGLGDGALCLARGVGNGERLARYLGAYALILEPREALGRRWEPQLGTFVVRVEDPSELLGWLLRRVEEGARVIVETTARTSAGARRVLLGVGGAASAIAWLDAIPSYWLGDDASGRWSLTRA